MPTNAEQAKEAIEVVCPGGLDRMEEFYRPDFHDHINAMEFHGDYVATHWTLTGTNRGRAVKLTENTLSRFEDGLIAEDWGSTDTIELARHSAHGACS